MMQNKQTQMQNEKTCEIDTQNEKKLTHTETHSHTKANTHTLHKHQHKIIIKLYK